MRWCLLLLAALQGAAAARILAFFPVPGRSHLITYAALTRGLAERGHDVTLVCAHPQPEDHPYRKVVVLGDVITAARSKQLLNADLKGFFQRISSFFQKIQMGEDAIAHAMAHPEVQEILRQPAGSYDAILLEPFFLQESLLGLGHKFQAPVIALHSHGDIIDLNYHVGIPTWPSYKPLPYGGFADEMDLLERTLNTMSSFSLILIKWYSDYPSQQRLMDKYFPGSPPLWELFPKVALTVLNGHHTLCYPSPSPPNVVFAGGMHINYEPKPLPKNLKEFVDGAKDGLIYFSLGTVMAASDMTDDQKSTFMEAFRSLKQRVLVKWNAESPSNVPSNVRLEAWMPQGDILAHPNTRLVITNGGLLSTQEAVYHGVPLIGIPRFADQRFNMRLARKKGFGIQLELNDLSKEKLVSNIQEIISNPQYASSARRLSQLFRDRPIKPLDNAVFWVEHVLKYGADHLKPASLKLKLYELLLWDQLAILFALFAGFVFLVKSLFFKRRKSNVSSVREKKNN